MPAWSGYVKDLPPPISMLLWLRAPGSLRQSRALYPAQEHSEKRNLNIEIGGGDTQTLRAFIYRLNG
jgi:hypothetical protein